MIYIKSVLKSTLTALNACILLHYFFPTPKGAHQLANQGAHGLVMYVQLHAAKVPGCGLLEELALLIDSWVQQLQSEVN
jgi:hypothetical protein